ncbi:NFACT family protein [Alteribacillus sp. HJP-4]|uniref:Rqc2 family fibronectin-binding protein n=1 Tax=Alteribacillus sp. HJP-4 TaxID=2775394 RepID=UPI0035CD08D1
MSFDGIVTRSVVHELSNNLINGRITKIKQPYKSDLFITVRANRKNFQLLISVNPSFSRMHLTDKKTENPADPPMFCMMLRKHLEGGFIRAINQQGMERVVTFEIEGRNELGDRSEKQLIFEIMGKHSNVLLVEKQSGLILDAIKHLPPSVNRHRTVLPGREYTAPPAQHKADPLTSDEDEVLRKLDFNQGKLAKQMVDAFTGISPLIASEIVHRAGLGDSRKAASSFTDVMEDIRSHHYRPQMIDVNGKEYYSVVELTYLQGKPRYFDTISELLERFHSGKAERDRVKQQAHDLERMLRNEWQKNKKKLKKLDQTIKKSEKALQSQKFGELLTANMHLLRGGEKHIEVLDYYEENGAQLTIPLNPEKSPSENAQNYFRKYNKAKTSLQMTAKQIRETNKEMDYLDQLIQQIESAAPSDIEDIREELSEQGYIKKRIQKNNKKKKKSSRPQPEKFTSSEGIEVLVGKNNKQNEYVTNRIAHQGDTWLHTKDIPGSHVVIRSDNFGEQTLLEAANIAAFYSKAKYSASVPVDYTIIKHVHKPSGAKPGFVTYDHQSTVFVTPDEDLVLRLRKTD